MDCLRAKDTASGGINILSQSLSGEEEPCWEMVNCAEAAMLSGSTECQESHNIEHFFKRQCLMLKLGAGLC